MRGAQSLSPENTCTFSTTTPQSCNPCRLALCSRAQACRLPRNPPAAPVALSAITQRFHTSPGTPQL